MTVKERLLWYWQREMDYRRRQMRCYQSDSPEYKHWKNEYESALRTYKEITNETAGEFI